MTWSVRIKRSAAQELARVSGPERARIVEAIDGLADNPLRGSVLKGDLKGLRRIRVSDYRIIYEVQDEYLVVLVVSVRHRRDVYR